MATTYVKNSIVSQAFLTDGSTWEDSTNAVIPAASLEAATEYLVYFEIYINSDSTANDQRSKLYNGEGDIQVTNFDSLIADYPDGDGTRHIYMARVTTEAVPTDIQIAYKGKSSGNFNEIMFSIFAIKLDGLTNETDYWWSEDTIDVVNPGPSGVDTLASVTPSVGADVLVFGQAEWANTFANSQTLNMRYGGADTPLAQMAQGASTLTYMGGMNAIVAADGTAVNLRVSTAFTTGTVNSSRIFVLNLSIFDDYKLTVDATDQGSYSGGASVECVRATTASTSDEADWHSVGGSFGSGSGMMTALYNDIDDAGDTLFAGNDDTLGKIDNMVQDLGMCVWGEELAVPAGSKYETAVFTANTTGNGGSREHNFVAQFVGGAGGGGEEVQGMDQDQFFRRKRMFQRIRTTGRRNIH